MSNLNYKQIFSESTKSFQKNPLWIIISLLFGALPVLIAYLTIRIGDNLISFFAFSVILFLFFFGVFYLDSAISLKSYLNKFKISNFNASIHQFASFITTSFLSGVIILLSAAPFLLSFILLAFAITNVILPYNKLNITSSDFFSIINQVKNYLIPSLALFLLNLPLVSYVFYKVGLAPLYSISKNLNPIESIKENMEASKEVNFVDGFLVFLFMLLVELLIGAILIFLIVMVFQEKFNPLYLLLTIPLAMLIHVQFLKLAVLYNKISKPVFLGKK
ncbi:MAG: hypothetical protein ACRCXZ_08730 [Patescibacteria group bacterium]